MIIYCINMTITYNNLELFYIAIQQKILIRFFFFPNRAALIIGDNMFQRALADMLPCVADD